MICRIAADVSATGDVIAPTVNSYTMQQIMPNAQLILYEDSNHGSFYPFPARFVSQADWFCSEY